MKKTLRQKSKKINKAKSRYTETWLVFGQSTVKLIMYTVVVRLEANDMLYLTKLNKLRKNKIIQLFQLIIVLILLKLILIITSITQFYILSIPQVIVIILFNLYLASAAYQVQSLNNILVTANCQGCTTYIRRKSRSNLALRYNIITRYNI